MTQPPSTNFQGRFSIRRPRTELRMRIAGPAGLVPGIVYGVALAFAGPAILIRNSVRGRRIENRPWKFVLGGCVIAAGWSFFSGTVILYGVGEATRVAGLGTGIA
ncbi:MAG: hypothetical protein AAFX39_06390 [Pseudomonadota bacterium]